MKNIENTKVNKVFDILAKMGLGLILLMFFLYLILGQLFMGSERTPSYLDYSDISKEWVLQKDDGSAGSIDLPAKVPANPGNVLSISKKLENKDYNGRWLMIWNKGQEAVVSVNDMVRYEYNRKTIHSIGRDIPYVYLFVPLSREDAGKTVNISFTSDNIADIGTLGGVWEGDKTSLILFAITPYQMEIFLAFYLVLLGFFSMGVSYVITFYKKSRDPLRYLGVGVFMTGFWIILNSQARQFVFQNVSIARNCAFLCVSTIPVPFSLYLDKIQEERFHLGYLIIEIAGIVNFVVTFILNIMGIRGLSEMFLGTFLIVMLPITWGILTLVLDSISKKIKKYILVAIGLLLFALGTVAQMFLYLTSESGIVGADVMILGILCMLFFSIIYSMKRFGVLYNDGQIAQETAENLKVASLTTLAKTVDAKDKYTKGHSDRVANYSKEIARRMGLDKSQQKNVYYVGLLHDVGKIGIPDAIINKQGKLTDDEYNIIKTHPGLGADILDEIKVIPDIEKGARWHHERFDGKGYPDGLKGEDIPLVARIIGVADAYDAMTSNRSYRKEMSQAIVRNEIEKNKGKQFDPLVATIMLKMIDEDIHFHMREKL